jgi:hypothetical protein
MKLEQYTKQHVLDLLTRLGYTDLADEARRVLPDPIDANELSQWWTQHGLSHDHLTSQMGGSP